MKKNSLLVTCVIGMALTGAAAILATPSLFSDGSQSNIWIVAMLGCLFLVFAAGARFAKPSDSPTAD